MKKRRADDLAGLTLTVATEPNPRDIEGWDFRNEDNTGPSTMNSSVFSQDDREFIFHRRWGRSSMVQDPAMTSVDDDLDRIEAFGEGELKITDLKLSPPRPGGTADIRADGVRLQADTWRQKGLEPRGTNKVNSP